MPFARPDLATLIERAATDIESRLPGTDARLRRSNLNVLGRVHAGAVHGLYGYLDFLARQLMPDTAEAEYLVRWASIWGVTRRPAAPAAGAVTFSGIDGVLIPSGTRVSRSDGAEFETAADGTPSSGTADIPVTAVLAGQAGNTAAGSSLNLVSPIAGIESASVVVAGGLAGGSEAEEDDMLRQRLLARLREQPHGGAEHDYVMWALEVPGVTRAWVFPQELGAGTVTVRFVRDDDDDLIPDAVEVQDVQDHIDAVRPVTAVLTVAAPVAVPLDFSIGIEPDTAEVRMAVEASLRDMLLRDAEPGATLYLSRIREAISVAAGEHNHTITAPVADVTHGVGEMAVMGGITWL